MADTPLINAQNPWPWLAPFTEDAAEFFNGRDEDADHLLRGVYASPVSVLFGKSGQGKTSLLQAGLAPRLRGEHLLPVVVRISYGRDESGAPPSVSGQLLKRLLDETARHGLQWRTLDEPAPPAADPRDQLWERLHDGDGVWRDAADQRWQPVFILDQFEEIFTLLDDDTQRRAIFEELGDLLENRIPPGVAARIRADATLRNRLDPDSQPYRIVIALREDYLPDLEEWVALIPRLGSNRYRLQAMTREQAQLAIAETGKALVTPEDAERILDYLLRRNVGEHARTRARQARRIDPAILSLLCSGLNAERLAQNPPPQRLQLDGLEQAGERILERFYDDAFKTLVEAERAPAQRFVYENLITDDGMRRPYPRLSAPGAGLSEAALRELVQRRLLRIEADSDDEQIELVHDRLAAIALERRRQAAALLKKIEEEAQRRRLQRQKRLKMMVGLGVLVLVVGISQVFMARERQYERKRLQQEFEKVSMALQGEADKLELAEKSKRNVAKIYRELERQHEELRTAQQVVLVEKARAVKARDEATQEAHRANAAETSAKEKAREATVLRLIAEGPAMTRGDSRGGPVRGLLTVLAAHRLAHGRNQRIEAKTYAALQGESRRFDRQLFLRATPPVYAVAYSPDGSRIVSGHEDGTLRFWDTTKTTVVGAPVRAHRGMVLSLSFSPDGRRIVSGGSDNFLRLWNSVNGMPIGLPLTGHTGPVHSVSFSPDGKRIISVSDDNTSRLWDASTGVELGKPMQGGRVAFDPKGQRFVSVDGATLRWWNSATGTPIGEPIKAFANNVAFSPDGKLIASDKYGYLQIWDAATSTLIATAKEGHRGPSNSIAFSLNSQQIITANNDHTLRVWDAATVAPLGEPIQGHLDSVVAAVFSPNGQRLVSGGDDGTLRVWISESTNPWTFTGFAIALNSDGRYLIEGNWGSFKLWDVVNRAHIGKPMPHSAALTSNIALSPDGRRFVTGVEGSTLQFWNAVTGKPIGKPMGGHTDWIEGITFSPDGTKVVSCSHDKTLRLWDAVSGSPIGKPLAGHTGMVVGAAFSPDNRRIVSASRDHTLRLWDALTGAPLLKPLEGHTGSVEDVAFSQDGQYIASASSDKTVRLWNSNTGTPVGMPLKGHTDMVTIIKFSPDGRHIISGSSDGTIRLWDVTTGSPVGEPLRGFKNTIGSLAFMPDGKAFASASFNSPRTFPILEGWADALCAKLERNMSRAEWREWVSPDIDYVKQCPDLPVPAD